MARARELAVSSRVDTRDRVAVITLVLVLFIWIGVLFTRRSIADLDAELDGTRVLIRAVAARPCVRP